MKFVNNLIWITYFLLVIVEKFQFTNQCFKLQSLEQAKAIMQRKPKKQEQKNLGTCFQKYPNIKINEILDYEKNLLNTEVSSEIRCFLHCQGMRRKILDENGFLDLDKLLLSIPKDVDRENFTKLITMCKQKVEKNICDTAFLQIKCVLLNTQNVLYGPISNDYDDVMPKA